MLPVDSPNFYVSSDVVCCECRKAFGGLIYVPERDAFIHRDPAECADRLRKASLRLKSV
jgi:hypothetical protein